jgi:hypothetical protein
MSHSPWESLLLEPAGLVGDHAFAAWFDAIARRLLCGCRLVAAGVPHRLTEVEFYYHGGDHLDPFSHRDPIQKELGRWYFHRTAGIYRSGSFKGLDLTFAGPAAFGGILIRGVEQEGGPLLDGPSLTVDHLLRTTETADVPELDAAIAGRPVWHPDSPLRLAWSDDVTDLAILKSARVGLSLKRMRRAEPPTRFILKPYRYLTEPRRIRKGKLHMALALHAGGATAGEIRARTACTMAALARYVADFEQGKREASFDPYFGIELGPRELARLHGLSWRVYGGG